MPPMLLDFFAVVLATGAIIEVWHKGSIFEGWRAYVEALQDVTEPDTPKGKLLELVTCPFCKSYHVPLYLFCLLLAADYFGATLGTCARVVVYSLAATRLSNLLDGLLPARMRYVPPLFGGDDGESGS